MYVDRFGGYNIWHLKIDRREAAVVQSFAYRLANTPHHAFGSLGFFGHATTCAIHCNTAVEKFRQDADRGRDVVTLVMCGC
jgi:hypothetical protein